MGDLPRDVARILIGSQTIQTRVQELADQISNDYRGKRLYMVGILKGAFIFMADLTHALFDPACCGFHGVI